jgi:hypothetical protein
MSQEKYLGVTEASAAIKALAAKNPVEFDVPQELVDRLLESWRGADPSAPAEIRFMVEGREVGNFKIAACAYWSDTCCA